MDEKEVTEIVRKHYSKVARSLGQGCSCKCGGKGMTAGEVSTAIGYSRDEITFVPEANLGLGCGNPLSLGALSEGETVLDLGSGAGFDCFLAAKKVGPAGHVIGVDMTDEMLELARKNAEKHKLTNVEFRKGYIEDLPLADLSVDVIISNCVINLAPDKMAVFKECGRVLKPGGRMYISDMVLIKELTEDQRKDPELIGGCVGGAILKEKYIDTVKKAGFKVDVLFEDRDIADEMYGGLPVMSLKLRAVKNS